MATRTEYQVVDSEETGNDVRTYKTLKEAKADYNKNKNALALIHIQSPFYRARRTSHFVYILLAVLSAHRYYLL